MLAGAGLWDLDPGDLGSDPSSASIHYATPGKALHLFELPFPQLYTKLQQACRIIMMVDLGQRQLKKGAWGGWAQFGHESCPLASPNRKFSLGSNLYIKISWDFTHIGMATIKNRK